MLFLLPLVAGANIMRAEVTQDGEIVSQGDDELAKGEEANQDGEVLSSGREEEEWWWYCRRRRVTTTTTTTPCPTDGGTWATLSVTSFAINSGVSCDWWSHCDVFAKVAKDDSDRSYYSVTLHDKHQGNFEMNLYIPSAGATDITLYDADYWSANDFIGKATITMCNGGLTGVGKEFTVSVKGSDGQTIGSLSGQLAAGGALRARADVLSARGVRPIFGDYKIGDKFALVPIDNDKIEHELGYAKTGSAIPSVLHGIWWMDQRGINLPIASDPNFKQSGSQAADELVVAFGEADWDPNTLCLKMTTWDGAPMGGHWTYMNDGHGGNAAWKLAESVKLPFHGCFDDDTYQVFQIHATLKIGDVLKSGIDVTLPPVIDGYITVPTSVFSYKMIKKPWGWDRESRIGPDIAKWKKALPKEWFFFVDFPNNVFHYPVFQIVDGNGQRTANYNAYLAWANNNTDCGEPSFHCPANKGGTKCLVARRVEG